MWNGLSKAKLTFDALLDWIMLASASRTAARISWSTSAMLLGRKLIRTGSRAMTS